MNRLGRNAVRKLVLYSKSGLRLAADDPISSWFYSVINRQSRRNRVFQGHPYVHYYEFGVGIRTLGRYLSAVRRFCEATGNDIMNFHVYAFDSFQGLPPKRSLKDDHVEWREGSFRTTLVDLKKQIKVSGFDPDAANIHYVPGFFEKSLTSSLRDQLKSHTPSIVTVDVDYYSSTKLILDWLRPILRTGVIFNFDDVWAFDGNPHYGQLAAINEFNKHRDGGLCPYPEFGLGGCAYIYWKRKFTE